MGVVEQEAGDVEPDWVGDGGALEEGDQITLESEIACVSGAGDEDNGLRCTLLAVLEGGGDVDGRAKGGFAEGVGCIFRSCFGVYG